MTRAPAALDSRGVASYRMPLRMLFPVLVATGSVALGAALATVPGARRALGPVRTAVLVLALAVAAVSLIPTAWRALGAISGGARPIRDVGSCVPQRSRGRSCAQDLSSPGTPCGRRS